MPKKIQLHVDEPCHENWDAMTKAEQGRFCDACQKQVVDFSTMSDREIAQFFKRPATGSVCGRFMTDQLDRDISVEKKRLPWLKYFFSVALPAFLLSKQAHTQGGVRKRIVNEKVEITLGSATSSDKKKLPVELIIVDSLTGEPLPYASIISVAPSWTGTTEEDGRIQGNLPSKTRQLTVTASFVGYADKTMSFPIDDALDKNSFMIPMMRDAKEIIPAVVVTGYSTRTVTCYLTGAVSVIKSEALTAKTKPVAKAPTPATKIFPNPLLKGQSATIEVEATANELINAVISNAEGRQLSIVKWPAIKGMNRFIIHTDAAWGAGMYFITLTTEKGEMIKTEQLIIQ